MKDLLKELLSFVEGEARWWDDAAAHCEEVSPELGSEEKRAKFLLLCAVYRERATAHRELIATMRKRGGIEK